VSDPSDPDAIASDIEQTRAQMSSTLDAIQERLDPERVAEQARETATEVTEQAKETAIEVTEQARDAAVEVIDHAIAEAKAAVQELGNQAKAAMRDATVGKVERMASKTGEAAGGVRAGIMTSIQQNPIPAALVGLGLGWMFLNRPSTSTPSQGYQRSGYQGGGEWARPASYYSSQAGYAPQPGYGSQAGGGAQAGSGSYSGGNVGQAVGDAAGQVQETAGQVAGQVQETAGQVVDQVQQAAGQVVDQVQETAGQARGRLEQMLHNNPMQVGAATLLLGGVLGLAKAPTQREQQLMGPARDRLVHQAQEAAQGTMQKVQRVAEEAVDAAGDEAREQGLTPQG